MALPITLAGSLAAAEIAWDTRFQQAYQKVSPLYAAIATKIPSNNRVQNYPIQARAAKLRKWTGERVVNNAKAYSYSIINEKYESTLGVPIEDFEDDQLNVYQATIDDMGEQAALWPDDLIFTAINDGENEVAYDGTNFFSASHSLGGNTIQNLFTGTALTHANYAVVREAMYTYPGENNESLRVEPNVLMVPPALELQGRQILQADYVDTVYGSNTAASMKSNVLKGTATLLVVPKLAAAFGGSDAAWYMLSTGRAIKPFIFQERVAPMFVMKNRPDDEEVFMHDQALYGVRARGAAGFGPFFLAAKAKA